MRTNITTLLSRALLALSVFLMAATSAWGAFEDIGGMKYSGGFYQIENANHLADLAVYVNGSGTYSTGTKNETKHDAYGLGFRVSSSYNNKLNSNVTLTPIGTYGSQFNGTFDGNNVRITGLKIGHTDTDQGLFGFIGENGYVGGLILEAPQFDGTITKGEACVGTIAAHNYGRITLSEVRKSSSVSTLNVSMSGTQTAYIGGIVGYNFKEISQCKYKYNLSVKGSVSGYHYVGAIAGNAGLKSQITLNLVDSTSLYTQTTGTKYYGAIVGSNSGTLDRNFYHNVKTGSSSNYQTGIGTSSGDVTTKDGAVAVFKLTSETGDVDIKTSPYSYSILNNVPYYAYNSKVTLEYFTNVSEGYYVQYTISSKKYNGGKTLTYTMLAKDAVITSAERYATAYTISYSLSNWTVPSSAPTYYNIGYYPTLPTPTRTGYTFNGWYTKSDYSGSKVISVPNTTGNITFYGKWIPNTYTVRFNSNDGTNRTATQNFSYGDSKSLQANPFTPTSGYGNLIKWTTNADGTGTSYNDKQSIKNLSSSDGAIVDIYAQWKKDLATNENITINEIPDQEWTGNAIKPAVTVMDGEKNITSETNITYSNNTAIGKATVTISAKSTSANYSGSISKTFKIVPIAYKITYVLYDGANPENAPTSYTSESEDITLPTPTKTGYIFGGWFTDDKFNTKVKTITNGSSGDITFYAKWSPIKYKVYFNANGGSGEDMPEQQFTYDTEQNLNANTYTSPKDKGGFLAWNTNAYGTGISYADGESVINLTSTLGGTVQLYAQWRKHFADANEFYIDIEDAYYTGYPIKPAVTIIKDAVDVSEDFSISYSNNINAGKASVTITIDSKIYPDYGGSITKYFNIKKAKPTVTAPVANELTYNGKAQALITAGSANTGTMLYSLDGKNYSEDIPTVTNAGTYTVYYKVEETDNYDGTEGSVEATIPGTFTEEAHIAINEVDGKKYVSIDMDSDAEGEFKITEDFEAENVKFNRTFTPNAYSTIILPFTVNTAKLAGVDSILAFSGLTVDKDGKKAVGMDVVWTKNKAHKDLAANTPYMIKMLNGNLDISGAVMFKKTEEAVVEVDNEYGNWQFCGTTTYKKWEENDPEIGSAYGFAASDDEELGVNTGDFVKIAAGAWIRPMRAYLVKQPGAKKVRANGSYAVKQSDALPEKMSIVVIDHDDNGGIHTTTIGFINTRTGAIQMNRTYDLKGRSVNSAKRTAKGAYYKKAIKK